MVLRERLMLRCNHSCQKIEQTYFAIKIGKNRVNGSKVTAFFSIFLKFVKKSNSTVLSDSTLQYLRSCQIW